ncbi:MAG: methyl-coenzyme M reductase family protein [Methanobacterium sp.]|nr:methyl-coenzyme M reductase family protein [Methanobacterium sp.]
MYKILVYKGGVYRFNEVLERVEDIGGIVLKKYGFNIRGSYFITQEQLITIIAPGESFYELKQIANELKGDIDEINIDNDIKVAVISILPVYNILSKLGTWMDVNWLKEEIKCPCIDSIRNGFNEIFCLHNLEETLINMCKMEIAEKRTVYSIDEYRLKKP